jgi:thiol-disulfide isomerase/thioredoxin
MKKVLLLASVLFFCFQSFAQQFAADSLPVYKQFPDIPPFSIFKVPDSTKFTKDNLKKKEPLVLIMFSPDCEHCQKETDSLLANITLFKKVQIVMASPLDYIHIKEFYEKYKIAEYPNITIGKDPIWFLGQYYKVRNFPTIVVYDKDGKFVKIFEGSVSVRKIAAEL